MAYTQSLRQSPYINSVAELPTVPLGERTAAGMAAGVNGEGENAGAMAPTPSVIAVPRRRPGPAWRAFHGGIDVENAVRSRIPSAHHTVPQTR